MWSGVGNTWNTFWSTGRGGQTRDWWNREAKPKWNNFTTWGRDMWNNPGGTWDRFWTTGRGGQTRDWWNREAKPHWTTFTTWAGSMWGGVNTLWSSFWTNLGSRAFQWGNNIVLSLAQGMRDRFRLIVQAGGALAVIVRDFMGWESPTKKGPGRHSHKWGPNLVKMIAGGIEDNVGLVSSASMKVASALELPTMASPAITSVGAAVAAGQGSDVASIVRAVIQEMASGTEREVVLNIDGQKIARAALLS